MKPIALASLVLLLAAAQATAAESWWKAVNTAELPPLDRPIEDVVDQFVNRELAEKGVTPAPEAPAETLIRRTTLDVAGRPPTLPEIDAFLADESPFRLTKVVEELIASPSFDRYLAYELNWLLMDGESSEFQKYLAAATESHKTWDAIFTDAVRGAAGGADQFLRGRVKDADKLSNDVSVIFFGVNVSCAQCHNHPYVESWTQDTYYGMKAFFGRMFENGGHAGERAYGEISFKTVAGDERPASPHFLGGPVIQEPKAPELTPEQRKAEKALLDELKTKKAAPPEPAYSRKARLVEAGLSDPDLYFARAIVNRTWHRLFGHGLVMPLDQMHGMNKPSHPELLQWLAMRVKADRYDLRPLIRGLVLSEAYRRDSQWQGAAPAMELFAAAQPRPLNPRQYAVALKMATQDPGYLGAEVKPEDRLKRLAGLEGSIGGLASRFERPGEAFQFSVDEAMYFSNSTEARDQYLNGGLANYLDRIPDVNGKIEAAYRSVLGRMPAREEALAIREYVESRPGRANEAMRQAVWALLTGSESRFNY